MEQRRLNWRKFAPGVAVLMHYDRSWLRGDVLAGLTVAAYLVPQVMAYAQVAGLHPVVGLWGMLAPMFLYAFVGPSRQMSVGPESTVALMTAACIGATVGQVDAERANAVASTLALLVGLVALIAWVLRLGFVANLLSRPILVGYLTGVAVLMICSQLGKVTGLSLAASDPGGEVVELVRRASEIHWPTVALASAVLVALFLLRWWRPRWPGPLLVIVASTLVMAVIDGPKLGLRVVGDVPDGLPAPWVPAPGIDPWQLLPYAAGIALVGYSDNVLTSRAFASKRREEVDASQEMLALGLFNVATAFLRGMPSSSSGSRTVLGATMGSRTQLHSLVALACVVVVLLVAGPVLGSFPLAALGAVIIFAAISLIEMAEMKRLLRFRMSEFGLMVATALGVVVLGVLYGILLAVVLSIINLVRRIGDPHDGILGYVPGLPGMHDVDDYPQARQVPGLVVYRFDAPIVFLNSATFLRKALEAVDTAAEPVYWFVLNAEANTEVDLTAVDTLDELRAALADRGIVFALARVKQELRDDLTEAGLVAHVGDDHIFATLPAAVSAFVAWHIDQRGSRPEGVPPGFPQVF